MSTNIERNIVEMRFDNKKFEKNVKQSMDSIDQFKKSLKFEDSEKSFKKLEENAKKVDLSPMSKGIDKVRASFSFLDTFSATVYHRISNRLIDIGKKVASSVSTDGIKGGFREYELKMNSFKTIRNATKESDDIINAELQRLNDYADQTIYKFSDMTDNIGKFVNAGVDLHKATDAIMGVSNAAALAGASSQQASMAMYNISQALGSGYMLSRDWYSIENAMMGTVEFKKALVDVALEEKTLIKQTNGLYKAIGGKQTFDPMGDFRGSLSQKWLTSDVLVKALAKYNDQTTELGQRARNAATEVSTFTKMIDALKEAIESGWGQTWEIVIGNLNEATELYTKINDKISTFIGNFFKEKKAVLENWKAHGGRTKALEALGQIMSNIGSVIKTVASAWRSMFPKKTHNDLLKATDALANFAKATKPSENALKNLKKTFQGLFAALDIVRMAVSAFRRTFGAFFIKVLKDAFGPILGVSGGLGKFVVNLRQSIKENNTFYKVANAIVKVFDTLYTIIKKVAYAITDFIITVKQVASDKVGMPLFKDWAADLWAAIKNFDLKAILANIKRMFAAIGRTIDGVMSRTFRFYEPLKQKMGEIKDAIMQSKVVAWVINVFDKMRDGVQNALNSFRNVKTDGVKDMTENVKNEASVISKIAGFFKKVAETIKSVVGFLWPIIKNVATTLGNGIKMMWEAITENIKNSDLGKAGLFAGGAGIFAFLWSAKKFIDNMKPLFKGFKGLQNIFEILAMATKLIKANILKQIATSILMLTASIFVLCSLPSNKVAGATLVIMSLFKGIADTFKIYDESVTKIKATTMLGMAGQLMGIALAIGVMVLAMRSIAKLDYETATRALLLVGMLTQMLQVTLSKIMSVGVKEDSTGVSIKIAGVATLILSFAVAVSSMLRTVKMMAKLMQKTDPKYIIGAMAIVILLMTVLGKITTKIAETASKAGDTIGKNAVSTGKSLVFFVGLYIMMRGVSKLLENIDDIIVGVGQMLTSSRVDIHGLQTGFTVLIEALAVAVGAIIGITAIAKSTTGGEIAKMAALVLIIKSFIATIGLLIALISLIPTKWKMTSTAVIIAIGAFITAILVALSKVMKVAKGKRGINPSAFAKIMGTITLCVLSIVAGLAILNKIGGHENYGKSVLMISAILAIFTIFAVLAGKSKTIAAGLTTMSMVAAGISAAALAITGILTLLANLTEEKISRIGTNIDKLLDVIVSKMDAIVFLIGSLIQAAVSAAITSVTFTIIQSARDIIEALGTVVDTLIIQAPVLIDKLLILLAEVISGIERGLEPLVEVALKTAIKFVNALANSIRDHKDEILDAIDNLFDAAAGLVASSVGRVIGLKHWEAGYNMLKGIIDKFGKLILGIFVIKKINNHSSTVGKLLSTFITKIKGFKGNLKENGFGDAWRGFFGVDKMNEEWKFCQDYVNQGFGKMGETIKMRMGIIAKSIATGAGIGLAVGSIVKSFIDAAADSIDVSGRFAGDIEHIFSDTSKKVQGTIQDIYASRKKYSEKYAEGATEFDDLEAYKNTLETLIDKNGNVISGHEVEVKNIIDHINDKIGERLKLENGVVSMLDEQGNKLKYESSQMDKLIQQARMKADVEMAAEEDKENRKQLKELNESRVDLEKNKDEISKDVSRLNEITGYSQAQLIRATTDSDFLKEMSSKWNAEELHKLWNSEAGELHLLAQKYGMNEEPYDTNEEKTAALAELMQRATKNLDSKINEVNNEASQLNGRIDLYTKARTALLQNDVEAFNGLIQQMEEGISLTANLGSRKVDLGEQRKLIDSMMNNFAAGGYTREQLESKLGAAKQLIATLKPEDLKSVVDANKLNTSFEDWVKDVEKFINNLPKATVIVDTDTSIEKNASGTSSAKGTDKKIINGLKINPFGDYMKDATELGKNYTDGTYTGMTDEAKKSAKTMAPPVINSATDALKWYSKTNSPSKLFADEVGYWLGAGIIQGINNAVNEYKPKETIQPLINMLQSSIFPAMAMLTNGASMSLPISPVFDGTNQNGTQNSIENIPAHSFAMQATYQSSLDAINSSLNLINTTLIDQTNGIIDEVRALRSDVGTLGDRIEDLDILLDGEALVGELTPRMSGSLVRYSKRVERGI